MAFSPSFVTILRQRELFGRRESYLVDNFYAVAEQKKKAPFYQRNLKAHFGCVNALAFARSGTSGRSFLASGGDDERVLLWNTSMATQIFDPKPAYQVMESKHTANIFCTSFNSDSARIASGGRDEKVLVHDASTGKIVDVFPLDGQVNGVDFHPDNPDVFASACLFGRVSLFDVRCSRSDPSSSLLARSSGPFRSVAFNPVEPDFVAVSNEDEGPALVDVRQPGRPLRRYGMRRRCRGWMGVAFNEDGSMVCALRRKGNPVVFDVNETRPFVQLDHPGYASNCTTMSGCFGRDYVYSGSDDFNVYAWKVAGLPRLANGQMVKLKTASFVLVGHRSIANQVAFDPNLEVVASGGIEKIVKLWSPVNFDHENVDEPHKLPKRREMYNFFEYSYILNSVTDEDVERAQANRESTEEDTRILAMFDALIQRDIDLSTDSDESADSETDSASDGHESSSSSEEEDYSGCDRFF